MAPAPGGAPPSPPRSDRSARAVWAVWIIGGACCAVEAGIWLLAGPGGGGAGRLRALLVENGGFWAGLLRDWRPNYAGQGAAMFLTYSFLHAGPGHLLGNMAALAWLGPGVARALGGLGFALAWVACAAAGGAAFALLAPTPQPMVGASGAVFGLLGLEAALRHRAGPGGRGRWARLGGVAALAVGLNAAGYLIEDGRLAWQAHGGGFLAGLALGALWPRARLRPPAPPPARPDGPSTLS